MLLHSLIVVVVVCRAAPSSGFKFGPLSALPAAPSVSFAQFAGQVEVNSSCPAALFAWLAKAKNGNKDAPVVLWLNGGPGSSSLLGWLFEGVGPFVAREGGRLVANPNGWNDKIDLLMMDQPAGVGLSYFSSAQCAPSNVFQSSQQLASALASLWRNPELGLASKPLYIFGESYGGTWVPLLAQQILADGNVPLGGMAIGDGWVNPLIQQESYFSMAVNHGLINGEVQESMVRSMTQKCVAAINESPPGQLIPGAVNDLCSMIEDYIQNVSNCNIYDVRSTGSYDFSVISDYLNQQSVFAALNVFQKVTDQPWAVDSDVIGNLFSTGEQNSWDDVYSSLWDKGVATLVYNGVFDLDCNFLGTDGWMEASAWGQSNGLQQVSRVPWLVNGTQVGMIRRVGPMQQAVILNSGHLVPLNVPAVAKEMMEQFVFSGRLENVE